MSKIEKLICTFEGGVPKPIIGDAATGLKVAKPKCKLDYCLYFELAEIVIALKNGP